MFLPMLVLVMGASGFVSSYAIAFRLASSPTIQAILAYLLMFAVVAITVQLAALLAVTIHRLYGTRRAMRLIMITADAPA